MAMEELTKKKVLVKLIQQCKTVPFFFLFFFLFGAVYLVPDKWKNEGVMLPRIQKSFKKKEARTTNLNDFLPLVVQTKLVSNGKPHPLWWHP